MLAQYSSATQNLHSRRSQPATRSRLVVSVGPDDAGAVRRALFAKLDRRIQRIVVVNGRELGSRQTLATLHIVMDREAVGEALHIVMSTARSAQFGLVQHF